MRYDDGIQERTSPDGAYIPEPERMDHFVAEILELRRGGMIRRDAPRTETHYRKPRKQRPMHYEKRRV